MRIHRARKIPNLELHIEELVLHGIEPLDRTELGAAVEAALTQLLAAHGVPPSLQQGGAMTAVDGGTFTARAGAGAQEIGGRIARAIYKSLGS